MNRFNRKKKAFTLLELLTVIVILSILFIVLLSHVDHSKLSGRKATANTDLLDLKRVSVLLATSYRGFPGTDEMLEEKLNELLIEKWEVKIKDDRVETTEKDPWGSAYRIYLEIPENTRGMVKIVCLGEDKQYETSDDLVSFIRYDLNGDHGRIMISADGTDFFPYGDDTAEEDSVIIDNQPTWGEPLIP